MPNGKRTPRDDAAPPDDVRRPGCGAWLAAAASFALLWVVVDGIIDSVVQPADDRPAFRIDDEDEENDKDEDKGDVEDRVEDQDQGQDEKPADMSLQDRLVELARLYVAGKLDLDGLRSRLEDVRGELNIVLVNETAAPRIRWLERLREVLRLASLASLALLLGPW
jgi:hypothetical protein